MGTSDITSRALLLLGVILFVVGSVFAVTQGMEYYIAQQRAREEGLEYAKKQSQAVADYINDEMQSVIDLSNWLVLEMSTMPLSEESISALAQQGYERKPNIYGVAIALEPYMLPDRRLFAPYYRHDDAGEPFITDVADDQDYTNPSDFEALWYTRVAGSQKPNWSIMYGPITRDWVIEYVVPFYRDGEFAGVVDVVHSVNNSVQDLFHQVPIGMEGYATLVDGTGKFAYHPHRPYIGMYLSEVADTLDNDLVIKDAARRMLSEDNFHVERNAALGFPSWTLFNTLPSSGWKTIVVIREDVKDIPAVEKTRLLLNIGIGIIIAVLGAALVIFKPQNGQNINIWSFSVTTGMAFFLGIAWVWMVVYQHPLENGSRTALVNSTAVVESLESLISSEKGLINGGPIQIPTGVSIETLTITSQNASVTGYVWQSFPLDINEEDIKPPLVSNQIRQPNWNQMYTFVYKARRVVGWFFTADLRQTFDVNRFPLDEVTVKITLEPSNMTKDMVFVPDFDGYEYISPSSTPGVAEGISLPEWNLRTSYFKFQPNTHNSNFGGPVDVYKNDNPALSYNIHATRKIISPLVAYCIVIYVILVQIFGLVVIRVRTPLEILSVGAALFLVNAISHNGLRVYLAASGLIYLEYFFILLYLTILASSINGLAHTLDLKWNILLWRENLLAKILFWPLFLGIALFFTLWTFYPR